MEEATGLASSVAVQESFQVGKAVVLGRPDPMDEEEGEARCLLEVSNLIAAVGQMRGNLHCVDMEEILIADHRRCDQLGRTGEQSVPRLSDLEFPFQRGFDSHFLLEKQFVD